MGWRQALGVVRHQLPARWRQPQFPTSTPARPVKQLSAWCWLAVHPQNINGAPSPPLHYLQYFSGTHVRAPHRAGGHRLALSVQSSRKHSALGRQRHRVHECGRCCPQQPFPKQIPIRRLPCRGCSRSGSPKVLRLRCCDARHFYSLPAMGVSFAAGVFQWAEFAVVALDIV